MTAGVLAILIAGFLTYLSNEYNLNMRTHRWNQSFHLGEAAVEVGFAEFNYQYSQGGSGFTSGRGWTDLGGGSYTKTVSNLTDDSGNTVGTLKVTASGVGGSNPQIQGEGTVSSSNYGGPSIARAVKVSLTGSSQFPGALITKNKLMLNGVGSVDSFDSSDSSKSTSGLYDPTKKQANAKVATTSSMAKGVETSGQTDIYGTVATGPSGTMQMQSDDTVGPTLVDPDRATTVAAGEANGWITHDFATTIPDATLPSGLSSASNLGTISSSTVINGGDWQANRINLDSGSKILTINGTVRLYVTGTITVSGSIVVASGASLELYAANKVTIGGAGLVNNAGGASKAKLYGLPTSTTWKLTLNPSMLASVYAPQAKVTVDIQGSSADMSGAIISDTLTLTGNVSFHYDEYLKTAGGSGSSGYSVASWQELRNVGGSWVP